MRRGGPNTWPLARRTSGGLNGLSPIESGYLGNMTSPGANVTPEAAEKDDDVLAPATPGAEALPLPDEEVEKPSDA